MRLLAFVEYSAITAGAMGIVAGRSFGLPDAFHLGVFIVGAGIAIGGVESLATGRWGFRYAEEGAEKHAGAPAVIFGLMALLVGAVVIGAAYLLANASWASALDFLRRRPGPVFAAAGLLAVGAGLLLALDAVRQEGLWRRLLLGLPETVVGALLLVAGAGAIGAGVWEWFAPQAFNRAAGLALQVWQGSALERLWREAVRAVW